MLRNYLRVAIRHLLKHRTYSIINIVGFSLALVPVILSLIYISYEFSYDKYNDNYDMIYRVAFDRQNYGRVEHAAITPNPLAAMMKSEIPEIVYAVQLRNFSENITYNNVKYPEKDICYADPDILNMFTIKLISGDKATALSDPHYILLSESMSKKYFGELNPVNKTISVGEFSEMIVRGVFQDIPANSHFTANFILPKSVLGQGIGDPNKWGNSMFYTYFMVKPNTDMSKLSARMYQLLNKYSSNDYFNSLNIYYQPLKDIHLYSNLKPELSKNGNINTVYLYALMALIMMIIAVVNYINLTTAKSSSRSKDIAIRKIVGAEKTQLIKQIFVESTLITILSFSLSIIIALITLPYFNNFVERSMSISIFIDGNVILSIIVLFAIISFCVGIYPALLISSIKPLSIFKSGNVATNSRIRNTLVVLQHILTIVLVFNSFIVKKQMNFLTNTDLGYNRDNTIIIPLENRPSISDVQTIKNELLQNSSIESVCASNALPHNISNGKPITWEGALPDKSLNANYNLIDYEFIKNYGIKIIEGRSFSKDYPSDMNGTIILSESAVKEMELKNPIGTIIKDGNNKREVVGIVKDFHMRSLHERIYPFYLAIDTSAKMYYLSLKVKSKDINNTLSFIKSKMVEFQPESPFKYDFFNDIINRYYTADQKIDTVFSLFSYFSLFIASSGIFGLISFITEIRKKEIGIRKVTGASSLQIGLWLLKDMMKIIIISSIIAAPISYLTISLWINNFAYKTDINAFIFIISSIVVYIVSLIAMMTQVYRASRQNPIEVLRYK